MCEAVKPIPDRQFLIPKLEELCTCWQTNSSAVVVELYKTGNNSCRLLVKNGAPGYLEGFCQSLMNCKSRKKSKKVNSFLFVLSFSPLNLQSHFLEEFNHVFYLIFFMSSVSSGIYRKGLLRPRSKGEYHSMCLLILIQAGCRHPLFPWVCTMPEKNVKMGKRTEF